MADERPRWLDVIDVAGRVLSLTAIPIVLGWAGNRLTASLKKDDIEVKYVELAVDVLRQDPKGQDAALRKWAINILATHTATPISPQVDAALMSKPLPNGGLDLRAIAAFLHDPDSGGGGKGPGA